MIRLKTEDEIDMMRISGKVVGGILYELRTFIEPGVTTLDIDSFVEERILAEGMEPTFKGYNDFPASACVSINEEIVHGIPSAERALLEGDIVGVDIGATYAGWVSDAARTYTVGAVSETAQRIVRVCKDGFFAGLKYCRKGYRLGDIGHAIQTKVESEGFSVVRDLVGHGVGREMHEDPQVKHYGDPGKGVKLLKGMALAIEPMINEGVYDTETLNDNWTIVTEDGKLSAHYENTIIITDSDPELITLDEREANE